MKRTTRGRADDNQIPVSVKQKRAKRKNGRGKSFDIKKWLDIENIVRHDEPLRESQFLDILLPQRKQIYKPRSRCNHIHKEVDLKNFSFLENPIETMSMLKSIVKMNSTAGHNEINFLDPICWDMAPYMILQLIAKDLDQTRISGGKITEFVGEIFEATAFVEALNIQKNSPKSRVLELWPIPLTRCSQPTENSFQNNLAPHAQIADQFTAKIEGWLKENGFKLNDDGSAMLMKMLGEVLNNSILHSGHGIGGDAWISGFMLKYGEQNGLPKYACHISIINLGKSIYESMQSCSQTLRDEIEGLIEKHHKEKFTLRKSYWDKETLWTLYALQDGVTSIHGTGKPRGGKGLMDMIDFFSKIGTNGSKLAIISGRVVLTITNPRPTVNEHGLRKLALNDGNDLALPPKKEYIKHLRKPFPGTILTWRFHMDPQLLQKLQV